MSSEVGGVDVGADLEVESAAWRGNLTCGVRELVVADASATESRDDRMHY